MTFKIQYFSDAKQADEALSDRTLTEAVRLVTDWLVGHGSGYAHILDMDSGGKLVATVSHSS
jgi:hypothetical protein